jgi:molybdate transport system ATP-binding protein
MLQVSLAQAYPGFRLAVDFTAPAGITALFGPSGAGKTSIVNAIAGLLRPDRGRVTQDGEVLTDTAVRLHLPPHRRRIGMVFQDARLFPHLSVRQNLTYGRWFARAPGPDFDRIVALLDIAPLLARGTHGLSGGERQRIALGRALLSAPRLLLLDEPLAALDAARKAEILPYLERLRDETRLPMLYVSHALDEVARLATTLVLLQHGKVVRSGPAAVLLADPDLAAHFGPGRAGAILQGRIVRHHDDGLTEVAAAGGTLFVPQVAAPAGTALRLHIAAQDVMLARDRPRGLSALNIVPGTVQVVRPAGDGTGVLVQISVGAEMLLARITGRSAAALALAPGVACFAVVKSVAVSGARIGVEGPVEPLPQPLSGAERGAR